MNDDRNATMADALRLTRDGRLMEATALLQQGLGGAGQSMPAQLVPAGGSHGRDRLPGPRLLGLQARLAQATRRPVRQSRLVRPGWSGQAARPPPRLRQARPAARSAT